MGVLRGRLLDISPVAYREVVESLNSARIRLDTNQQDSKPMTPAASTREATTSANCRDALETYGLEHRKSDRRLNDDAEDAQAVTSSATGFRCPAHPAV